MNRPPVDLVHLVRVIRNPFHRGNVRIIPAHREPEAIAALQLLKARNDKG